MTRIDENAWHPTEDDWAAVAAHGANAASYARVQDHIVRCGQCATLFRTIGGQRRLEAGAPDERRGDRYRSWLRGAAVVAALSLAVAGWTWVTRVPATETMVRQAPVTAIPATREPDVVVASIAPWAALGPPPDVQLPASMTLEVRGTRERNDAFLRAFGAAIKPYRAGQFAEAAGALEALTTVYADVPELWFYLGASRLHADDPSGAASALRKALTSSEVGDQAQWLEAVALERERRHERAGQILDELCGRPGPNRDRACQARGARR